MRRARLAALAMTLAAGCGATTEAPRETSPSDTVDRCVLALRFVSDEADARVADDAAGRAVEPNAVPVAPTTELSLVRICDQNGRVVSSLGSQRGVCQYVPDTPAALISARCWWPGEVGVSLRVVREGRRVFVVALEESGAADPVTLGDLEVPARARLDVLAPGHTRPEP
ncbi:MAG: hypothetical protein K1X94_03320 [Sandaracinaceae bacterium]|nr:hypothetical protein [Sandaracinaceae bacterium]